MKKHAFLIMAYKTDECLATLLQCIDDERNDIFIHMDRKNRSYKTDWAKQYVKKSNLFHVQRTSVTWGGYSQINAELVLLKEAVAKGHYAYYHLLSGADLPLVSQDDFHLFFDKAKDTNFVSVDTNDELTDFRIKNYHFFREMIGRNENPMPFFRRLLRKINFITLDIQKKLHITRNANLIVYKGANWFSITDAFAGYVVQRQKWIQRHFMHTVCGDEEFLQTLLMASPYAQSNAGRDMRFIDWKRGSPYIYQKEDYQLLIHSGMIFARKFSAETDKDIITLIKNYCLS